MPHKLLTLVLAALVVLAGAPAYGQATPHGHRPRDVVRAAHRMDCEVAGPMSLDGPRNHGVLCWRDLEHHRGQLVVLHYADPDRAARWWRGFLAGQGCVVRGPGHVFVVPSGMPWYDCQAARRAARQVHGRVIR